MNAPAQAASSDLVADLRLLDRLTDGEADNLRTMVRDGDLDEDDSTLTWAVVLDSWQQMPEDVQALYGDTAALDAALTRVIAAEGEDGDVEHAYRALGLL